MKKARFYLSLIIICCSITSCDYGNMLEIQQKSDYYESYTDSVLKLSPVKSYSNWKQITKKHDSLKHEVTLVSKNLKKDDAINEMIKTRSHTFDTFKKSSLTAFRKLNTNDSILLLQKKIFKVNFNNLHFKEITPTNVLTAFIDIENFLDENSTTLSKADWKRIHIIYDALNHRKKMILNDVSDEDRMQINKIQPKIFALIKLNDLLK
jgi:hypothetical protein